MASSASTPVLLLVLLGCMLAMPGLGQAQGQQKRAVPAIVEAPRTNDIVEAEQASSSATASSEEETVSNDSAVVGNNVLLSVRARDVKALRHFLRSHYKKALTRSFTSLSSAILCDPDECYSNCYLQGFRGGKCKEDKCFCTQVPPVHFTAHESNALPT